MDRETAMERAIHKVLDADTMQDLLHGTGLAEVLRESLASPASPRVETETDCGACCTATWCELVKQCLAESTPKRKPKLAEAVIAAAAPEPAQDIAKLIADKSTEIERTLPGVCVWETNKPEPAQDGARETVERMVEKHAGALSLLARTSEQEARENGLRVQLAEAQIEITRLTSLLAQAEQERKAGECNPGTCEAPSWRFRVEQAEVESAALVARLATATAGAPHDR